MDTQGSLSIRQLASVLLKQYVEAHWCQHSEKFRPPETTDAVCDISYTIFLILIFTTNLQCLTLPKGFVVKLSSEICL